MHRQDQLRHISEATEPEIDAALKKCAAISRKAAGNFYYAFIFLPKEKRRGIQALYAFLRAGDDAADDPDLDNHNALASLRKKLDRCFKGYYTGYKTLALAWANQRFDFTKEHFEDMFRGLESDLAGERYETFEDTRNYCYRVASTVGLLCLKIFGADTEESRKFAVDLGIAMQLTNILRDIKEDWDQGRIYLPQEDLKKFDLQSENLFLPENQANFKKLVLFEVERAEDYFQNAGAYFPYQLKRKLFAAQIMGAIYRSILKRIKSSDDFTKRVELSRREKLAIGYEIIRNKTK